jgi:hypothetical protein
MRQIDGIIPVKHYNKPKPTLEALDVVHNIILIGILLYLGGYLIYQGLPTNNFCRQVANSTKLIKLDIVQCYPDTKDYYLSK